MARCCQLAALVIEKGVDTVNPIFAAMFALVVNTTSMFRGEQAPMQPSLDAPKRSDAGAGQRKKSEIHRLIPSTLTMEIR